MLELFMTCIGLLFTLPGLISLAAILSTSLAFVTGFCLALIYASYSYTDGSENTRSRYSPWIQSILAFILVPFSRHYTSYTIEYHPRTVNDDNNDDVLKAKKRLKQEVKEYLDIKNDKVCIFAASPHGLIASASAFQVITPYKEYWNQAVLCVHKHLFKIPFLRDLFLALGLINITRANMENQLLNEHRSIYIVPGGCREMIIDKKNPIQSYHKGFLKLAFDKKIPVIPILHLGQDDVFPSYSCPWLDKIRFIFLDLIGYPFPCLFFGPFSKKLTSIVMEPIHPSLFENENEFIEAYYMSVKLCHSNLQSSSSKEHVIDK